MSSVSKYSELPKIIDQEELDRIANLKKRRKLFKEQLKLKNKKLNKIDDDDDDEDDDDDDFDMDDANLADNLEGLDNSKSLDKLRRVLGAFMYLFAHTSLSVNLSKY